MINPISAGSINFYSTQNVEKEQSDVVAQHDTKNNSKKIRNWIIAGAAITAIVIGGLAARSNVASKVDINAKKYSKEYEEYIKKTEEEQKKYWDDLLEKMKKDHEDWIRKLNESREYSRKIDEAYENFFGKTANTGQYYYWSEEIRKSQEEFKRKMNNLNEKMRQTQEEMRKSHQETQEQYRKWYEDLKQEQEEAKNKYNYNHTNSTTTNSTGTRTENTTNSHSSNQSKTNWDTNEAVYTQKEKEIIDKLFDSKEFKETVFEEKINDIAEFLKTTPEELTKLKNGDKSVYRKMTVKLHPDRNQNDPKAHARYIFVTRIWEARKI